MPDPQSPPINPFVYTDTPANYASTPEQVAQMRALSNYNMTEMPQAKSWAGVLAHALGGYAGNQQMQQANQLQQAGLAQAARQQGSIGQPGGNGGLLGGSLRMQREGQAIPFLQWGPLLRVLKAGVLLTLILSMALRAKMVIIPLANIRSWGQIFPVGRRRLQDNHLPASNSRQAPRCKKLSLDQGWGYLQTHSPQDAASMWISGKPLAQALASGNRPDVNGTTPSAYSAAVVNALRGGGQQMAQASPTTGMNGPQYGAVMANPWINQETKSQYQQAQTPQTRVGATGQIIPFTPGQQQGGTGELAPGYVTAPFGVPGFQGTAGAPTRGGVPGNPQAIVPPLNGGQGGSAGVNDWAGYGRGLQGQTDTQGNQIQTLRDYTNAGGESRRMLGLLGNLEEAGKHVGQAGWQQYVPGQWLAYAQSHGIPVDQDGSITAFKVAAMQALGTGPEWQGLREQIPQLNNTPEARAALLQQIKSTHQYIAQRGDRSRGLGLDGKPDPALNTGGPEVYGNRLNAAQEVQMQTPGGNTPNAPVNPKQGNIPTQATAPAAPIVRKWKRQADGSMGLSE